MLPSEHFQIVAMMGSTNSRKKNFTEFEKNLLLSCITPYKNIIENKQTDGRSVRIKSEAWQKVAEMFNQSTQINEKATPKQLNRLFGNMKQRGEIAKGAFQEHLMTDNNIIIQNNSDKALENNNECDDSQIQVKVEDNTFSETSDSATTPLTVPGSTTQPSPVFYGPIRVRRKHRTSSLSSLPETPEAMMFSGNATFAHFEKQLYKEKLRTQQEKTREARARADLAELELALFRRKSNCEAVTQ